MIVTTPGGPTLAPGGTGRFVTTLDRRLPDGPWQVTLRAWSGRTEETLVAEVTFPDSGLRTAVPVEGAVVPAWLPTVVWGSAVPALVLGWLLWRRRRRDPTAG